MRFRGCPHRKHDESRTSQRRARQRVDLAWLLPVDGRHIFGRTCRIPLGICPMGRQGRALLNLLNRLSCNAAPFWGGMWRCAKRAVAFQDKWRDFFQAD
jgi:hypothetical protein